MKKIISLLMALLLLGSLSACGKKESSVAPERTWTRQGYFTDDQEHMLSVSYSEEPEYPGWYVGCVLGDGLYGWYIQEQGDTLHGDLAAGETGAEPFVVTISEEGDTGLLLEVENGESYHFHPMELQSASISVRVNTEGMGQIAYAPEGEAVQFDDNTPYQSAQFGLAEAEVYTLAAKPDEGWKFLKWTKDGADFATDAEISVELTQSAEFVAVFGVAGSDETHVELDSVQTLGDVLGLPNYGSGYTEEEYIYAFEQDGTCYRAIAKLTVSVRDALSGLDFEDADYEAKLAELVAPLEVERIENVTAAIPTQEELDALAGKTGAELLDDGWTVSGWNLDEMEFYLNHSLFSFTAILEGEADAGDFSEEDIRALTVQSVTYDGLGDVTNPDVTLNG